MSSHFG
ncbi:hypothetical protein VTH06DRAFT_7925 [Thermothelomyces fergusii]